MEEAQSRLPSPEGQVQREAPQAPPLQIPEGPEGHASEEF
jgi:hypothetical protein